MRKLPLNQKTTIIAQKFIIAVATKINSDEVDISYISLENHQEVLRIRERIDTGSQILKYLDPGYWSIYSDGSYITDFDLSAFRDMKVKIKVTTHDKSLEILGFENRISKNQKPDVKNGTKKGIVDQVK